MDRLGALETFIAVVEEGSLSQAARRLDRTPSAVTKNLAALEDAMGARLLERTTRQLRLTEAGQLCLATAYEVTQKFAEGRRRLLERDGAPHGLLKVTCAHSFGRAVLGPLSAGIAAAHPGLQLDIQLSDRYVDIVGEGYDLAFRMGNYELPNQIVRAIGNNRTLLCASPAYLAARGQPATPEALTQHDCLVYRHPMLSTLWHFSRQQEQHAVEPKGAITTDSYNLALQAALDGAGILPCPQWSVTAYLERGELVPLLTNWRFSSASFGDAQLCAVYPASRRGSPKVKVLVEAVEARLAETEARIERLLR